MGTISVRIVRDPTKKADDSFFDACIDPQFNGVFPEDANLGIVSERKANARVPANNRTTDNPRRSQDHETIINDPRPSRLR